VGGDLSEIEIAASWAVLSPGVAHTKFVQGRCASRFWHRTKSIGSSGAPLFPPLGIASLLVAGPTMSLKNLDTG
jgi:hypothetical protein